MAGIGLKDLFARRREGGDESNSTSISQSPQLGASVLVVDDSRTMVHAMRSFLERYGYRTMGAFDGVQAVAAARAHTPDLILMDIVMPNMNGFEATRTLRKDPATRDIPVIIVSASEKPTDRVWGTRLGAKGYLAKPIHKTALLKTVESVLMEVRYDTSRHETSQQAYTAAPAERPRRVLAVAAS
jgi:twitching motility two-component system response regulator PilH